MLARFGLLRRQGVEIDLLVILYMNHTYISIFFSLLSISLIFPSHLSIL
jgi:hypothetical protein